MEEVIGIGREEKEKQGMKREGEGREERN